MSLPRLQNIEPSRNAIAVEKRLTDVGEQHTTPGWTRRAACRLEEEYHRERSNSDHRGVSGAGVGKGDRGPDPILSVSLSWRSSSAMV